MPKLEEEILSNKIDIIDRTPPSSDKFIGSGSCILNLALSGIPNGGWRKGRIVNIVGDKSTGKTLLAMEAMTYALKVCGKSSKVRCIYDETESAFDGEYAKALNMPVDEIEFRQSALVSDFYKNIEELLEDTDYDLLVYVLDSLDALSSSREEGVEFGKQDFAVGKASDMAKFFRKLVRKISNKNILIIIISQIRDNIGVTFGRQYSRSGGHALDFYASQIVWLAVAGKLKIKDTIVGVNIKAKVDKNKVSDPFRECNFPILFRYGVDDIGSMVDYLIDKTVIKKSGAWLVWGDKKYHREDLIMELEDNRDKLVEIVTQTWKESENIPQTRKPKYS